MIIETDSLIVARALNEDVVNLLEVGHIMEQCRLLLQELPLVSLSHIQKQANRVAHGLARLPCSLNCFPVLSSPPTLLIWWRPC